MASFTGEVVASWHGHGRTMKIVDEVKFTDKDGKEWIAPAGAEVDGASIPRLFWSLIGSPFVGRFRRASVIHDVYCVSKSRSHQATHKCFYEMMLVDGVSKLKAWTMYQAVKWMGPKWS